MVVSFHPLFTADRNILCAGRDPGPTDLAAIREARAVILPRHAHVGFTTWLAITVLTYSLIMMHGSVIRQNRPDQAFPRHIVTPSANRNFLQPVEFRAPLPRPKPPTSALVFKFDWGGEGDTVFLVQSPGELEELLQHTARCEASGQSGFMLQKYIPSGNRSLRVAVIGDSRISYWRIGKEPVGFHASLSKGAKIDTQADPALKDRAEMMVAEFCRRVGINLAGLDVIFAAGESSPQPLVLEINYFFGRVGLGGSEEYYRILKSAIKHWLKTIGAGRETDSIKDFVGMNRRYP